MNPLSRANALGCKIFFATLLRLRHNGSNGYTRIGRWFHMCSCGAPSLEQLSATARGSTTRKQHKYCFRCLPPGGSHALPSQLLGLLHVCQGPLDTHHGTSRGRGSCGTALSSRHGDQVVPLPLQQALLEPTSITIIRSEGTVSELRASPTDTDVCVQDPDGVQVDLVVDFGD